MPTRLERLVAMDEEILRGGYPNVEKFCRLFEVQPRTVYEDIRKLKEDMGREIEFDRFHNGYFNKNPKKELPKFELTNGEVFALTLGKEMLSAYTGTSFESILKSGLEKIHDRLPDRVEVDLDDIRCMVKFHAGPSVPVSRKMFLDLNRACEKSLPVEIEYFTASRNEVTKRTVNPHRLIENRGTWYALAFCTLRKDLRLFALHRIRHYDLLDARFTPVPDNQIDAWLGSALFLEHTEKETRVTIRFLPAAARYIREKQWHPTQELVEHDDGSCTLSLTTPSLDETKRWVMTFGAQAEVLEPPEFREAVAGELRQALARYGAANAVR